VRNLGQVGDAPADQQLPPGARVAPGFPVPLVQMTLPALRAVGGWVSPSAWRSTANLGVSLAVGGLFAFAAVWALLLVAATVWILGVGTTARAGTLWLAVQMARLDRRRIAWFSEVGIDPPTLPRAEPGAGFHARPRAWARSPWLWRLLAYQLVRLPVFGALVFGAVVWWWAVIVCFMLASQPAWPVQLLAWRVGPVNPGPAEIAGLVTVGVAGPWRGRGRGRG
jgi:hypothetical protein